MAVDNDTGIGVRPNAGMIEKDLAVELTGGPADGPALHDFHNLQIAWDDVWTTIVDGRLAGKMAELYKKVVEVVDWGEANPDPSEIKELEQFLLNLEEAIETATGISEDISGVKKSPELFAWVPELEPKWNILSAFHREQMWSLYWTDQYDWESWKGKPFNRENWTIESHINSWDPGPPFLEYEYSPLIPLQRLWEIGQSHKEWLQYRIGDLHPNWGRNRALSILNQYQPVPGQAETPKRAQVLPSATLGRAKRLLKEIQKSLSEPYRFDVFKPCTHNFGIITTYRQRWQPQAYQVGELVGTLPLAPGEKRTYTKKRVIKTSRAQKEVEKALSSRSGESTETTRAEAEILRKASYSTNFKMTAEGGFSVGVVNANASSEYAANQALESSQKKRDFREAVRKAAQEYRNERTIEVSAEETFSDEFTETGEVSNVNDELTVTYLFYELQRRFEVSERLHKVTPVILVAFEVPAPNKIDEAWLLEHEWILRRVILDDELLTALDYLTDTFAGDELGVEVHRVHWQTQIQVVKELHETAALHSQARQTARSALKGAISTVASTGGGGVFDTVGDFLFGDDDADQTAAVEARRQAAQTALEWAEADMVAASERLSSAVSALQEATEAYTSALERRLNRRVSIDQLRLHVKQNILYYMQAIWLHEPSDQRYLRIYDKEIEWPEIKDAEVYLTPVSQHLNIPDIPGDLFESNQPQVTWVEAEMPPSVLEKTRKLHEVADIDNLLGFKGNYAIFPLTERNALTDYMMQSFLDSYFGVFDPDPFGEIPAPSEALEIARCAWKGASEEEKERITHWLVEVLNNQRRTSEIIIVPTEHLFIEALPGAHPLLEDFKLRHRKVDVQKARAEALQEKLEALRYAARIVKGELGDPDVETQIVGPDSLGVNVDTANAPDSSTELNSNS
ncbi:MAG: hypothetical protein GY805_30930 [Chloroflexi bacterium]|nr:hypothetical protein [Chloroflexota bacterium]